MRAEFNILNCCGDLIKTTVIAVRDDLHLDDDCDEYQVGNEYAIRALASAGMANRRCDGCGDTAYRVLFSKFVD